MFKFKLSAFVLFLSITHAYSQTKTSFLILDTQTLLPIENVYFIINNNVAGFTNKQGIFTYEIDMDIDSITISHVSYLKKKICPKNIEKEIVYLNPIIELDEVFLRTNKIQKEIIPKSSKLFHKRYTAIEGLFSRELATYIPNDKEIKGLTIKSIIVQPYHDAWGDPNRMYMPFRVNLFSVDTTTYLPKEKLLQKGILVRRTKGTGKYLVIDVSDFLIDFPKEGVFVVVETLSKKEYQKYIKISNEYPAFRYIMKDKNTKFVTYIKFYSEDKKRIIYNWGEPQPYEFIYLFGIELE